MHLKLTQGQHFLDLQTTLTREIFKVKVKWSEMVKLFYLVHINMELQKL